MDEETLRRRISRKESVLVGPSLRHCVELFQSFSYACLNESGSGQAELVKQSAATFLREISLFEFDLETAYRISSVCDVEIRQYNDAQTLLLSEVQTAHERIEQLQTNLQNATVLRIHRQQCEKFATLANEIQPRSKTMVEVSQLKALILDLNTRLTSLRGKIDIRFKQLYSLTKAISEVRASLDDERLSQSYNDKAFMESIRDEPLTARKRQLAEDGEEIEDDDFHLSKRSRDDVN